MKFSWKVLVALGALVGVVFWGANSLRTRSYSGTTLNFGVGGGPVTVENSMDTAVPAQLVSTGARSFVVSSTSEGISGSSMRQGSGSSATQLFELDLPPGVTELVIVERSSAVSFVAVAGSGLDVTVHPLSENNTRLVAIVAAIVVLGALFYISRATGHRWIKLIRREKTPIHDTKPHESYVSNSYLES
jgi:hypothetical protein